MTPLTRRAALLAATLLPGCGTIDDILGERKRPLPGERRGVIAPEPPISPDAEEAGRVSLPAPVPVANWPMVGGPPTQAAGHVAIGETPALAWRSSIGSGSGYRQRIVAGPVISGGSVFAVDAWGNATAVGLADGRQRWRTDTTRESESASPLGGGAAAGDGAVHVATGLAELVTLDAATGAVRWRVGLPGTPRGAPTLADGRIFVATIENQLVALAAEDGRQLWTRRAGAAVTIPLGVPAPAVADEAVVAGFGSGELVALRAADGRLLWAENLGPVGGASMVDIVGISGQPVIAGGRVIAVGQGNSTIAVDLRSGRRLWERSFGGGNGVATAGDWAFAVTRGGEAMAIGREDGRISWVTTLDPNPPTGRNAQPTRFGPPLVAGGRLLVPSSRNEILLLDPTGGQVAGRIPVGGTIGLTMAVAENTLVALTEDGTLLALR